MKISHQWLNKFIKLDAFTKDQISEHLTLLGLEIDTMEDVGNKLEGVVIGKIEEVSQHPNADKLRLCRVNLGTETVQIVCGATNVAVGQKVPVATIGTILPTADGSIFKIKKGKLRGEESMGMICAEDELGLSDNHDGIMVFDDPENTLEPGTHISNVIDTWSDTVYDIELTPNRPDAACHLGVARDLSAKFDMELVEPSNTATVNSVDIQTTVSNDTPTIRIEDELLCNRYVAIELEGITIADSPAWLKNYLHSVGLRPINNVVDATNYIMLSYGQPMHAFDLAKLHGELIEVKAFEEKKHFKTLDGVEREVPAGSLFICDKNGPVALAGVMGGENSEVDSSTTKILLESAYFDPISVRKTAKALSLQTDSSYRFERGIDPNGCLDAAKICAQLIIDIAGGTVAKSILDLYPKKHSPISITFRPSFCTSILGISIDTTQMIKIFERLAFDVKQIGEALLVTVPTFRPDIEREIDLVEEIIRVYDINAIPTPTLAPYVRPDAIPMFELVKERIKQLAVSLGFQEIYTNSLLAESADDESLNRVKTLNPLSSEMSVLRDNLTAGMLRSVAHNYNRNAIGMQFFEIGNVFSTCDENEGSFHPGIKEDTLIQLSISGLKNAKNWRETEQEFDFFALKEACLSLLSGLGIQVSKLSEEVVDSALVLRYKQTDVAKIYAISNDELKKWKIKKAVYTASLSLASLIEQANLSYKYQTISKFPPVEFDMAFILDKTVSAGAVASTIRTTVKEKLVDLQIFDIYEGDKMVEGKKSVAFRLQLQSDTTLSSKDIEQVIKKVANRLSADYAAELRDE